MANLPYPRRDIDRPDTLLGHLGSHWDSVYRGQQQIRAIAAGRGRVANQTDIDRQETVAAISRLTTPVHHIDHWYRIVLRESELNTDLVSTVRYGDYVRPGEHYVYGNDPATGGELKYGRPVDFYAAFPLPADIADVPFVFNRVSAPSLTYVKGLDYLLRDGAIVFRENPFNNALVPSRDVYQNGAVIDRELSLWFFRAQREVEDIYWQHAYLLKLRLPSSASYRDFVNAVLDGVVEGAAGKHLEAAFAALCGTPVVASDGEVVAHVGKDARHLLVITDRQVYRYPLNAAAIVAVGDVVNAGDQLVDTVQFIEFNDGEVPADLPALELGRGLLPPGYMGGITWHNKTVPVVVDASGIFTRIEWELGGFPGDVQKFWDDFHANGVLRPPTLAQLLNVGNTASEPTAASLPATINPLAFLASNVLRHHAFVVRVRLTRFGADALGIQHARHLRRIIPPHTHMILVVELAVDTEVITMEGPGDEASPGYTEAPLLGYGLEPVTETIDGSTMITGTPTLRYTEGQCI